MIAQRVPDITDVLDRLGRDRLTRNGEPFVCAGGTLVRTDRVEARADAGDHLWYFSGRAFDDNVQVLTDRTGFPVPQRWSRARPMTSPLPGLMLYRPCTERLRWGRQRRQGPHRSWHAARVRMPRGR